MFASDRFTRQPHFHSKLRHYTLTLDEVIALGKLQLKVQFLFIQGRGGRYASHLYDKAAKKGDRHSKNPMPVPFFCCFF
ncbi:hypothetical protein [Paenibacillus algorifonticola]|uniref:hypothetical protein n=1 Tax=Paenibacillus algorifonticola TaxID=684063 RepID=UPI0006193AD4|nr:hypothetical protein [Paenibacillus algorifonticola]